MKKHLANTCTGYRIFGSFLLLFFPVFSAEFYLTYVLCGVSDMIDGMVARKTNSTSEFGSRLDTIADFIFAVVSLWKLLPVLHIPGWMWTWGGAIAAVKIGSIAAGYCLKRQFISMHTVLNKTAGFLLFLWPLTVSLTEWKFMGIVVCFIATFAALQEAAYVITDR